MHKIAANRLILFHGKVSSIRGVMFFRWRTHPLYFTPKPDTSWRTLSNLMGKYFTQSPEALLVGNAVHGNQKSGVHQLRLVVYFIPSFTGVLAPCQVVVWDFWTINSIPPASNQNYLSNCLVRIFSMFPGGYSQHIHMKKSITFWLTWNGSEPKCPPWRFQTWGFHHVFSMFRWLEPRYSALAFFCAWHVGPQNPCRDYPLFRV